jgi:hypothetical protein
MRERGRGGGSLLTVRVRVLASVEGMQRFPVPLQQNNNGLVGDVFVLGGGWCWRGRRKEGRRGRKEDDDI